MVRKQAMVEGWQRGCGTARSPGEAGQERETEKEVAIRETSHVLEFSSLCKKWGVGEGGPLFHFPQ